jgi:hypothetical protein
MTDGTVFAGISPDTGKEMFAKAADAPLSYTFNEARKYAKDLDAHGHQGLARADERRTERAL